ncbi:POTE ankyrin domain family member A-like [Lepus europaeus]|uniref:POTE ankyrin domain family member A-like n=1 Tax=Lepus europaeus TaxID=9983 RepID=UPI002B466572|nr:POTE ankyrin domain family member A-like [Lepus europaeus]
MLPVDVKHLQQQHDELQQRQSKSEASLEDMACFYYKLNNKTKDIMDELGEINRKFQEAAALHQEEVQNVRKLQDHLEHYNARLKYENSVLKDTIKIQANRIEEQQKYLIRPSSFQEAEALHLEVVPKVQKSQNHLAHHNSRTALHWACAKGHQDVVALLISRACQIDRQDKRAATPLIKAVQCCTEYCTTLLLDHGADPNSADEIGNTALHYVAYGENVRMAEKLLSSNADIEKKNKTGLTPLLVAIQQNQESMVKFLILQNADVFAIDKLHRTSLMFAARYSTENIVHILLELGVDVLSEDLAGHSARDHALQKRNMLLEIPDVNHELIASYEKGLISFAKKDLIIPGCTSAIIHSAPEEQPKNDRITRVHGVHEDNKCGAEDEAKESTSDPEEGTSTVAGKKSKKHVAITQVAPLETINKYGKDSDHGLDKDNKHSECISIKT